MNRFFVTVSVFLLITGLAFTLRADQNNSYPIRAAKKAAHGTVNILSGWFEVPKQIVDITQETKNPLWGVVAGGFLGTLKAVSKTASGISDVVSAPVSLGKD